MAGELDTPAVLSPMEGAPIHTRYEAGLVPQSVQTVWSGVKFHNTVGNRNRRLWSPITLCILYGNYDVFGNVLAGDGVVDPSPSGSPTLLLTNRSRRLPVGLTARTLPVVSCP